MSLVAAELERRGIPTVALQLLELVARKVRPPRAIFVPHRHGYPLAAPHAPDAQHAILEAALQVFEASYTSGPVLLHYDP